MSSVMTHAGTSRRRPTRRRRGAAAVLACALGLAAACGGGGGGSPASTAADPDAPVAAARPADFTGTVDEFYEVPDPLPEGAPGELIRVMPVSDDATTVTVRVMYHSRDARNRDRAVTGIVTYPTAAAPAGGWPVVAWAHGTTGLAAPCAPSRGGGPAPAFGVDGVRVATDYIGLGPVGERHPYLSGQSEAHSVIDAVRAARLLPEASAGTRWVAVGHSQGGHAALFAHELGQAYAPELELLGTAALAPAAVFERRFGPADQVVPHMVGAMGLYGLAAENPDIAVEDYVSEEVAAVDQVVDEGCLGEIVDAFIRIPIEDFYDRSPFETEPALSVLRANDPGHAAVDAPLLLASGTADTWVVPARVQALFDQLCAAGQATELVAIDGADHNVTPAMSDRVRAWFADRLAGVDPTDSCSGGG
jgi:alpha-beta hydrolase superfamily lysophospholipase